MVESYNGGKQGNGYEIENILNPNNYIKHCSKPGTKHTVSLTHKDEKTFRVYSLKIDAAPSCTSNLKTGILFVTEKKILTEDLDIFDNLSEEAIRKKLQDSEIKTKFGCQAQVFVTPTGSIQIHVDKDSNTN